MSGSQRLVTLAQISDAEPKAPRQPPALSVGTFHSENEPPKRLRKGKEVSIAAVISPAQQSRKGGACSTSRPAPLTLQVAQPSRDNVRLPQKPGQNATGDDTKRTVLPKANVLSDANSNARLKGRRSNKIRRKPNITTSVMNNPPLLPLTAAVGKPPTKKGEAATHSERLKLVIPRLDRSSTRTMHPPRNCRSMILELPREIRDMIYDLVYNEAFVQHSSFYCGQHPDTVRASVYSKEGGKLQVSYHAPVHHRPADPTLATIVLRGTSSENNRCMPLINVPALPKPVLKKTQRRVPKGTPKETSLMFTCKQIHHEFSQLAYSKTIFAFGSPHGLRRMLRDGPSVSPGHSQRPQAQSPISATNRSAIRHLCLSIGAWGEPCSRSDTIWRAKYYAAWISTCNFVATNLPALEHLTVLVEIPCGRPLTLALGAPWAAPLLEFASLKNIKTISITMSSPKDRNISYETLGAFTGILLRLASGGDPVAALKAIEWWKLKHARDEKGLSLAGQWRMLEEWNGLGMGTSK